MNEHVLEYYLLLLELNTDYNESLELLDRVWNERRNSIKA